MKILIFIALSAFFAFTSGVFVPPRPGHHKHSVSIKKECSLGQSYWCQNLTSAAGCHAVKHCIQAVWEHQQLPPDSSSICQTCLDMVKQARDQLLSNDTQELIKEVFEGSCHLLKLKVIVQECDKIADEFIPELIDTLASEMNPQVVCSVAGLCNNEKVHRLLEAQGEVIKEPVMGKDSCEGCHTVVDLMEKKFDKMSRDEVLQGFLMICGKLGSFSDACSNIVVSYFNDIYLHIKENLNSNDVCLLAGECSAQFHTHVEITPNSHVGYVQVGKEKDDLPCELCEQLVQHLRELLIANTTENEFKLVLEGLCKQSKSFESECLSLVSQYYGMIYQFLVSELNSTVVCSLAGICPNSKEFFLDGPIAPLLPEKTDVEALQITPQTPAKTNQVPFRKAQTSLEIMTPENAQLPIDLLVPPHAQQIYDSEVCVFCEYFLHFLQQVLTSQQTEEEIREVIDKACEKLPSSINSTCVQFVESYEPALVAILAQRIDPSLVCPKLRACPTTRKPDDIEIFMQQEPHPNCGLCLFSVTKLEEMIKNDRTENNIKNALSKLCDHMSKNLAEECNDFVNTYTKELVEMMVADLSPQEVCVYLKFCSDNSPAPQTLPKPINKNVIGGDVYTNSIPDNTVEGKPVDSTASPECVLCEFVMKEIDDQLKNKNNEDEIKTIVHGICKSLPKSISKECNQFVDEYADMVITLLAESMEPGRICTYIGLCHKALLEQANGEIIECTICELAVEAMKKILKNPKTDHEMNHVLEKTCRALPHHYREKCKKEIEKHGSEIFHMVVHHFDKRKICKTVQFCEEPRTRRGLLGENKCTWGPDYWCQSEEIASSCGNGAKMHCEAKVWSKNRSRRDVPVLGREKCTFGPAYWCASPENAEECQARKHCEEKVWNRKNKRSTLVGSNPCTRGPGHWCASPENAEKCGPGAIKHCEEKVWSKNRSQRDVPVLGREKCTFGPSYWCASPEKADECQARKHCEEKVWNKKNRRSTIPGSDPCTYGPSHWCASPENADKCGLGARKHCEEKVWNKKNKRSTIPGSDPCTYGPSHWCASPENADKCGPGARKHCEEKVWSKNRSQRDVPVLGKQKCTFGPSYWCASPQNADECQARKHCEEKVWNKKNKRSTIPGSNPCTYGPSHWCASPENADKCGPGARKHCEEKVWSKNRSQRDVPVLGREKCTFGPSYWCASPENADECQARKHCEEKVWNKKNKRSTIPGSNPCTYGPSHWCASPENADKCGPGARKHCEEKVWSKNRSQRDVPVLGKQKCTFGPSYWCASPQNADECQARKHCEEKVWNKKNKRSTVVGNNPCTNGPSYWCANSANADKCGPGARKHCEEKVWMLKRSQ